MENKKYKHIITFYPTTKEQQKRLDKKYLKMISNATIIFVDKEGNIKGNIK